ncbi:MAG: hypothetical protein HOI42_14920 [Candidatus Marinimicrobia bacterium]|mgnify:FL=1|jgi:hypothetical protein|nr:hypothetical protein [Candidatus Neomarinimicrobiota bacterium]MBT6218042.1 hypothetical protein [Candidatus Neomarinimicrobiota bacterium]
MVNYPKFSDFAEEVKPFDGDKKRIDTILNQAILVVDFKIKKSKQKQDSLYATIQFKIEDVTYIVFTGSGVLIEQLEKYKDNLPFYTEIKKIDKYYTFT